MTIMPKLENLLRWVFGKNAFCSINTLSGHAYSSPYIIMYNMTEISVMAAQRVNSSGGNTNNNTFYEMISNFTTLFS